ncbi:putative membrane protein [Actinacidiphila reveromycinica]|uniref:Putative membrane protein n=1 Tax=Actinacidiphila reveromycinica TaxID=659352 RepID=A0A7U3VQG6_9ACTN|nr:putative membrane protein [Streptomyces sp. SN-593]
MTRLPWIGPRIARAMRTHAWRAFAHLQTVHWTRLAAAMTFTSFLSLFPLLAVVAAVGAATLSQGQLDTLEHKITQQIPGIADKLDIDGLVANAGTIGVTAAAALVFTGIGWVGSLRDCLRAVWDKDDEERNPVKAKLSDGGVLLGLGAAVLVSLAASGFATAAVNWTADQAGLDNHGPGRVLLTLVGYVLAVVADFLILVYVLTLLPGVEPPRRAVATAALIGAVGFEVLKVALSGYLRGVAGKSVYGAFGTPIALLLWLNFMAKLLLYCAAWTATPQGEAAPSGTVSASGADGDGGDGTRDGRQEAPDRKAADPRSPDQTSPERPAPDRPAPDRTSPAPKPPAASPGPASAAGPATAPGSGSHRWRPPRTEADGGAARR